MGPGFGSELGIQIPAQGQGCQIRPLTWHTEPHYPGCRRHGGGGSEPRAVVASAVGHCLAPRSWAGQGPVTLGTAASVDESCLRLGVHPGPDTGLRPLRAADHSKPWAADSRTAPSQSPKPFRCCTVIPCSSACLPSHPVGKEASQWGLTCAHQAHRHAPGPRGPPDSQRSSLSRLAFLMC